MRVVCLPVPVDAYNLLTVDVFLKYFEPICWNRVSHWIWSSSIQLHLPSSKTPCAPPCRAIYPPCGFWGSKLGCSYLHSHHLSTAASHLPGFTLARIHSEWLLPFLLRFSFESFMWEMFLKSLPLNKAWKSWQERKGKKVAFSVPWSLPHTLDWVCGNHSGVPCIPSLPHAASLFKVLIVWRAESTAGAPAGKNALVEFLRAPW